MARKLSATEKLARDICWLGFRNPTAYGTKKAYWESVAPSAKKGYLEHAAELIWWTRRLGASRLIIAVEEHDAASPKTAERANAQEPMAK